MRSLALFAALACLVSALATAQELALPFEYPVFRSSLDGSEQLYALYAPKAVQSDRKYPLVVSLHAEETNHRVNIVQIFGLGRSGADISLLIPRNQRLLREDVILASPLARGSVGYAGIPERDVYDMIAELKRRFSIDEDRIYLTGISMGADGALRLALTRPDMWAAVAAVSIVAPAGLEELAPNALDLPIRLYHGSLDPLTPAASIRTWQKRFLDAGVPVEYIEYPGASHNAWQFAYAEGAAINWFLQFKRQPSPVNVRFATRSYEYASSYWVRIDGLTPGVLASIDARSAAKGEYRVTTQDVDGFSLVGALPAPPSTVLIDGQTLRLKPGVPASFSRVAGKWQAVALRPSGKRAGAEGPISAAVSGAHIYVYGTADRPSADVLAARKQAAETAADWSPELGVRFKMPVKADADVTAEDIENADIVLFGNTASNSLIARFAPQLPLALRPGAADYGLLFVAPMGRRYVLVSSGLPWWTGADPSSRGGDRFAPPQFRLLSTLGDFVLFRGSLDHVVSEGRFDRNWKVPAEAAAAMTATGTVAIR